MINCEKEVSDMANIDFHPVWDEQVTDLERERLLQFASGKIIEQDMLSIILFRGKYKKNGAIVATVLIGNGYDRMIHLKKVHVEVLAQDGEPIARESFTTDLQIKANAWQPWSFVFQKESMLTEDKSKNTAWIVEIENQS